ncbi:MAG: hypothetical protein ACXIUP_00220 [Microcella sp.]
MAEPKWARGSNQYVKRPRANTSWPDAEITLPGNADRLTATGIHWDSAALNLDLLTRHNTERALARVRGALPNFVWDAAALEGNTYTLPEVQTLLEGTTVGGRPIDDERQVLALRDAFTLLDALVRDGRYALDKTTSDRLHGVVAEHEAIESGHFRGEGRVGGGGLVSLGALGSYRASDPGTGGGTLIDEHAHLVDYLASLTDPREQALAYFCAAARRQFYFDGNKRTARLMMNGHLMAHGYDAISVSAVRRIEFNEHLINLFDTGDATPLMQFTIDCRMKDAA